MDTRKRIYTATAIFVGIFLGGAFGYMLVEGYSFFQGIYMSAITISTVGYGEVVPLSPMGQAFSIVLIFCSIGGLAFAGRALGESLVENAWSGRSEKRKMQRAVDSLNGHHIICGFGRVGKAAAAQFDAARASFVVVEQHHDEDYSVKPPGFPLLEGDATREQVLLAAGIKRARGLLALLGSDPENVFLVLTARELNPTLRIIARANDPSVENKLHKAGADKVISPFITAGTQVANEMLMSTGQRDDECAGAELDNKPHWLALEPGDPLIGLRVNEAIQQHGRTILGLRRGKRDHLMPGAQEVLKAGDALLVLANTTNRNEGTTEGSVNRTVVIIDDNPVIVKLYTRLFQKAGFHPHTAADGKSGLDLILKLKPTAAVIDFMLPILSGIEICNHVRSVAECEDVHLILFTADDNTATRNRALEAGADAVVVKSPEAQEVIETVIRIIAEKRGIER